MSDPSGCVTYKPAALELYAPHANLPYNKMREPQKKKRQWIRDATQNILFERFGLRMVIWCVFLNTPSLLCLPAAFIKERKMGLNDFIQKLVSTPHICQQ